MILDPILNLLLDSFADIFTAKTRKERLEALAGFVLMIIIIGGLIMGLVFLMLMFL